MKKKQLKCKWYISVVAICFVSFSLLCWMRFAKTLCLEFLADVNYRGEVIQAETEQIETIGTGFETRKFVCINLLNKLSAYVDTLDQYIEKFQAVWQDEIFHRAFFSRVDSVFTYCTTGEISSCQVVKGEGKWLFYKSATDGSPIDDFEGTNYYTTGELDNIAENALWVQGKMEKRGIQFVLMTVPNKENVYSEFMPEMYVHAEQSATDILADFLWKKGVNIVNPKEDLLEAHSDYQLYYSYDTHWNQLGSYIGVRSIFETWGIDMPALKERYILSEDLSENYHYCAEDDLAKMIGLRGEGI